MKNINIYLNNLFLIFVALSCFTSCSFLDRTDVDKLAKKDFYKTENDIYLALNAAYSGLKNNYYNNMYHWTEERSDNTSLMQKSANSGVFNEFDTYKLSSSNTEIQRAWNGIFTCIYRANVVLDKIDNITMDGVKRNQYKAQAIFLRALSYYHLAQLFGDVPILIKPLETETEVSNCGRRPVLEVYDQIVKDLIFVIDSELPLNWGFDRANENFGRVSKTAGYALLGKVYLTMAKRLENADNKNYLKLAKIVLEKAYEAKPFDNLSSIAYNRVFGPTNITNNEIIFQVMYLQSTAEASSFAKAFQPLNMTGLISKAGGGGDNVLEDNMVAEYENGDKRTKISYRSSGNVKYVYKYVDLGDADGRGGSCWIVLRYADVYLMLAEVNEALGYATDAVSYLNEVRKRAGLSNYENVSDTYKNAYPTLKDAILHERRIELAFENHRWYDLLRFYKSDELVQFLSSKSVEGVTLRDLLLPIPLRETQLNPIKMYQNLGY